MAEAAPAPSAEKKPGSPMKLVIVIIVGALLLVAVSIGGVFFMMKSMGMLGAGGAAGGHAAADSHAKNEPAIYFPLEPAFVVNFKEGNRTRFLQVTMEVMARDPHMIEEIKKHMPLIRNNLLLLLGSQKAEDFQTSEGKEKVRTQALEEIKKILTEETGNIKNVEGLYFTSFVTQ